MLRVVLALFIVSSLACSGGETSGGDSASRTAAAADSARLSGAIGDSATPGGDSAGVPAVSTATAGVPPAGGAAPGGVVGPAPGSTQPTAESQIPAEDLAPVVAPTLPQVDTTITIRAHGPELIFDPQMIVLREGTRVRIRFANAGTFAHNFILVRDEDDLDELAARAVDARENVPVSLKSKLFAYTNIAHPAQTVETAFVVPPAGDYTYVSFVEGHANTMLGKLRSIR
jgi:plastocyanin